MTKIKNLDLTKQHQEEALGFHQLASAETAKCNDAKFTPLQTAYKTAIERFDEALKTGGASVLSDQLADLDARRDKAYSGLAAQIKNAQNHFDAAKATAAKEANLILRKYGVPNPLSYVEENGVIHNIIQDLETFDAGNDSGGDDGGEDILSLSAPASRATANRLALIGAREWLDHLKSVNNEFLALFAQRNIEQSATVTGASTATRTAVDAAYQAAVTRINALAEVNGEADYIDVINALNRLIDRQKAVLAARKTTNANAKKKKEEAGGEDIL